MSSSSRHLPHWYPWLVLCAGTLAVYSALGLARFGYTVVLPSMQATLYLDNYQAGTLASANLVGYLIMALLGGALASHYGARKVVVSGLLLISLGMFFTSFSHSFREAALWRFITGVGSGAANVAVMGMWASWFPQQRRGLAGGIAVTGSAFAMITTGPLVPWIIARSSLEGWRSCWELFALLSFLIALFCFVVIKKSSSAVNLSSPYAMLPERNEVNKDGAWHSILKMKDAWKLGTVYTAFGFSYIIYMTFFIKHLMIAGGYDKGTAGKAFTIIGWTCLIFSFFWGWLSDRLGRKWTMAIVYLIHAAAFALFGFSTSHPLFVLSASLYGATAFSIPAIMSAACGDMFGKKLAPAALGFVTLLFGVGQALGPGVAGKIADTTGSFSSAFYLAAFVSILGAIGSVALPEKKQGSST